MNRAHKMPLAYGYIRFSSDAQEQGDSIRRQREGILAWLKRHKAEAKLDPTLGEGGFFVDQGLTGFAPTGEKRSNLTDYKLGEFLDHCEKGRVQRGSYLIVESADRLSRESPVIAINLLTRLLIYGAVVVTLSPENEYRTDADIGKIITVGVTIDRAHDESRVKRHRGRNAWEAKRQNAKAQPMSQLVPSWCRLVGAKKVANRLVGGEIRADAAKVTTVRRLFRLALAGKGVNAIARELNAERVPVVGRSERWTDGGVYHILTSPAVLGEYHPHTGRMGNRKKGKAHTRKPTGEVIENYYPAVIDREQFRAVQAGLHQRSNFRGRRGKHTNLFAGLLVDARDGGSITYRYPKEKPSFLLPVNAKNGAGGVWASFPAAPFEDAILSKLVELKAGDVLIESDQGGKVLQLSARYAEKEAELAEFRKEIDADPRLVKTLKATLIRLEEEREQLADQLADAQREAASPLAEAWGEFQGVAELLAKDGTGELRLRCQTALRRLVESVTCIFAGPRMTRLAYARVQFRGSGLHRDYIIVTMLRNRHRLNPPPPAVFAPDAAWTDQPGDRDIRKPDDAAAVVRLLEGLDLAKLVARGKPRGNATVGAAR